MTDSEIATPGTPERESASSHAEGESVQTEGAASKKPQVKKRTVKPKESELVREARQSFLPFARVQKIIKADKELPIIQKEATRIMSLATEEFIQRWTQAAHRVADGERRTTVQIKDMRNVSRRAEEFMFLNEILATIQVPAPNAFTATKRVPAAKKKAVPRTMLDNFVGLKDKDSENDAGAGVVVNEDGTMTVADSGADGDIGGGGDDEDDYNMDDEDAVYEGGEDEGEGEGDTTDGDVELGAESVGASGSVGDEDAELDEDEDGDDGGPVPTSEPDSDDGGGGLSEMDEGRDTEDEGR